MRQNECGNEYLRPSCDRRVTRYFLTSTTIQRRNQLFSSPETMLRVLARRKVVLGPRIASPLSRCVQVRLAPPRTRTLVTSPPWKGGTPITSPLSHPASSTTLNFRIRQHNEISNGRQLRFNSTVNNNKTGVVHNNVAVAENASGHESDRPRSSILARIFAKSPQGLSSFTKIVSLAKPEKKPLLIAVGLLFMSASVSMSIPFTIGRLIDFFSSSNPVRRYSCLQLIAG